MRAVLEVNGPPMTEAEQGDLLATLADLPDDAVRRIVSTAENERDLRWEFEQFHQANPGVYALLVSLCRELKAHGHEHIGIATVYEHARWMGLVGDTLALDGYKLNNNHRAFYARLIMEQEQDLVGMFETRRQKAV